ncbi:MAG: DUF4238 domain-containing protein, partial [Chryseobacterium sp.]
MPVDSKKHHFVPRFILRNFQTAKKILYVFDNSTCSIFKSNADNVGHENNFNTIHIDSDSINLEHLYDDIDASGSQVIAKILKGEHSWDLSGAEMETLARFVAAQFLRTPRSRIQIKDFNEQLVDFVKKGSPKKENLPVNLRRMSESETKLIALSSLQDLDEYASLILERHLVIYNTNIPLYISDNPVKLYNPRPGKLPGLNVIGTDIYLPISANRILCFMCKSSRTILFNNIARLRKERKKIPEVMKSVFLSMVERKINSFSVSNTEFCNHLQVKSASRFIYSSSEDFSLAKEMTAENPNLKAGGDTFAMDGGYFPNLPLGEIAVISLSEDTEQIYPVNILPSEFQIKVQVTSPD